MRPAIDRRFPTRLLADPHAVGDFGGDGATDRAVRADAFVDGDSGAFGGRRASLGLTHACEREGAESGQAASGDARAAQESAAIDASLRLIGERNS